MNNNEEMTVPKKLYHYTSKDGFLGIIENKTLWASEILFMNDGKEACIPLEILKELLEENKNEWKDFLELYESVRGVETYVISFSEKKDDLNMWRAYGDNASGICIEFNSCTLFETLIENHEKIKSMKWRKCIYDKQEQKDKIQSLLDSEKGSNDLNSKSRFEKLLDFSTYFKDESFKDEHEWRIVVELNTGENREAIKVRTGKNDFVPYYELRIEKEKLHSESEDKYPGLGDVIVGSATANLDLFFASVSQACFVNRIEFCDTSNRHLLKSVIPYRG